MKKPGSPTGSIFFLGKDPASGGQSLFDANTPGYPGNPNTLAIGQPLCDDYTLETEYTFYTTGLPNRYQDSGKSQVRNQNVGHFQMVLLLMQHGADANIKDGEGCSGLHLGKLNIHALKI